MLWRYGEILSLVTTFGEHQRERETREKKREEKTIVFVEEKQNKIIFMIFWLLKGIKIDVISSVDHIWSTVGIKIAEMTQFLIDLN